MEGNFKTRKKSWSWKLFKYFFPLESNTEHGSQKKKPVENTPMNPRHSIALAIYEMKQLSFQLFYLSFTMVSLTSLSIEEFLPFFHANSIDRQHSDRGHGKRKAAQLKRQQFLSLDSQSIYVCNEIFLYRHLFLLNKRFALLLIPFESKLISDQCRNESLKICNNSTFVPFSLARGEIIISSRSSKTERCQNERKR